MNCSKCKNNATIHTTYAEGIYCKKHFLEMIEKRIRKDLRTNNSIDLRKTHFIENPASVESKITSHFLKNIFGEYIKISKTNKKGCIKLKSQSLDSETDALLESFLKNKNQTKSNKTLEINPLRTITDTDISELSKILQIKYEKPKRNEIASKLEEKYPGTRFSLMKSKEFLENFEKRKKNKEIKK